MNTTTTSSPFARERRAPSAGGDQAGAAQALAAEVAILRRGIGEVREAAAGWLPSVLTSLARAAHLATSGAARLDGTAGELDASLARLSDAVRALDARLAEVAAQAASDPLTGVLNRAGLDRRLAEAVAEADATGRPLSVMFCDIDGFKRFNDQYGHHVGDHALRLVATALGAYPDPRKAVGRYGGEEFVLAMPGRTGREGLFVAQTIATALAGRAVRMRGTGEPLGPVTLSAGVAERRANEDAARLLRRADAAMYRAKRAGGNRVAAADEGEGWPAGAA